MPETLDLPDLRVLLVHPSHVHHRPAHEWLAEAPAFATTPVTESGLVRLLMNPTVAGREITGREALTVLAGVRADARAGSSLTTRASRNRTSACWGWPVPGRSLTGTC